MWRADAVRMDARWTRCPHGVAMRLRRVVSLLAVVALLIGVAPLGVTAASGSPTRTAAISTAAADYRPLTATRLFDTRKGLNVAKKKLAAGKAAVVTAAGQAGLPTTGVGAVVLELSGVSASVAGGLSVYATGAAVPAVPSMAVTKGRNETTLVVTGVAANGTFSVRNDTGTVHAVGDVVGWFPTGSGMNVLVPTKVLDSAAGIGMAAGKLGPTATVPVTIGGVGGVPAGVGGTAVVAVRARNASLATDVTVWPTGDVMPGSPQLSIKPGVDEQNLAFVPIAPNGTVSVHNAVGTVDVDVTIVAFLPATADYTPIVPQRVLDTKAGVGAPKAPLKAKATVNLTVGGTAAVPLAGVTAVVVQLGVTPTSGSTDVTAWPTGAALPGVPSTGAAKKGEVEQNLAVVPLDATGRLSIRNRAGKADIVADVVGYFANPVSGTWRFVPDTITLNATGQVQTAQLTKFADDGSVITTQPPAGVTSTAVGDSGVATIVDNANGSTQMTATATIGSSLRAYNVPGQSAPVPLSIMNVRLAPGVQVVARSNIFFPPPGLPDGVDPLTAGLPGISASGIGPFTVAEIAQRAALNQPIDASGGPVTPTMLLPYVLRGVAPATGTVLLGSGGNTIFGRVVQPNGFPTITRSGYSLITVASVPFGAVYDQVHWDISETDITGAGFALGAPQTLSARNIPARGAASPKTTAFRRALRASIGETKSARAATPSARTARAAADPTAASDCAPKLSGSMGSLAITPPNIVPLPIFEPDISYDSAGNKQFDVQLGFSLNASAGISGVLQFSGGISGTCTFAELAEVKIPVPFLGPLAAVFDFFAGADLKMDYNITVSGGPKLEVGASCSASVRSTVGFRYNEATGFSTLPPSAPPPTASCTPVMRATSPTTNAAKVDASLTIYGEVPFGMVFGGRVASLLGALSGNSSLGELEVGNAKLGPRAHLVWDSDQQVLFAKDSASFIGLDIQPTAQIKIAALDSASRYLFGNSFSFPSITLTIPAIPLDGFYKAAEPNPAVGLVVRVNGVTQPSASGNVVDVSVGDTIDFDAGLRPKPIALAPDPTITGGAAYIANGSAWDLFPAFDPISTGAIPTHVAGTGTVTQGVCNTIGTTAEEVRLLADAPMLGVLPTGSYAGSFTIKCSPQSMKWRQTSLELSAADSNLSDEATLVPHGLAGVSWDLVNAANWPVWLTESATGGTFNTAQDPTDITFTVDCSKMNPKAKLHYTVTARTLDPAINPPITSDLDIVADCRPAFIEWQVPVVSGTTTTPFDTYGKSNGRWDLDPATLTTAPQWLRINGLSGGPVAISPLTGNYGPGKQSIDVGFTVMPRTAKCKTQAARSHDITVLTTYVSGPSEDRGKDTITITQPAVPGDPSKCNGADAYSWGDPHIGTFDGNRYDTQVLGEYVYLEPLAGAVGPTLHVRHELTRPGALGLAQPTSVTAVSLQTEGHKVEVYERPTPATVYIDGTSTALADGVPIALTDTMSVVRTGSSIAVTSSEIDVTVISRGGILDLYTNVAGGAPVRGLLGNPDGNAANDLMTRGGTTYTLGQVQQHSTELYAITDSWRVTDPAASTFTVPYAGFNDPNLPYSVAALAPYRAQVISQLGSITAICDNGGGASSALIDQLALELAIGRPVAELSRYTCSYVVNGTVHAGSAGTVPGAEVTVDGPGLAPCVTTSSTVGTYTCRLVPDFSEITSPTPILPLPITATARWNGSASPVATNTVQLPVLAGLAASPSSATVDLDVDPATLPTLVLGGTFVDNNGPVTQNVGMTIKAFDASNKVVSDTFDFVYPAADGTYSTRRVLPHGAVRADVVFQIGPAVDWITNAATGLVDGPNGFTFDVDQRVPRLDVSGAFTGIGGAPLGSTYVHLQAFDTGGSKIVDTFAYVQPDPVDGSYAFGYDLPKAAVRATLDANYGVTASDATVVQVPTLQKGPNPVTLSLSYQPAVLQLSGTMLRFGQPFTQVVRTVFTAYDANGNQLAGGPWQRLPNIFNPTGSYTLNERLPLATARVDVSAQPTFNPADFSTISLTSLHVGTNPATLNLDYAPPRITVSGLARNNGAPATGQIQLDVKQFDAAGNLTGSQSGAANPANGTYSLQLIETEKTDHVLIDAWSTIDPAQKTTIAVNNLAHGGQYTATADVDIQTLRVTVHGTISTMGVPIDFTNPAASLRFSALDGNGQLIQGYSANHQVATGAGGSYSVQLTPPLAARTIIASADLNASGRGVTVTQQFPVVVGDNDVVFSPDTMIVDLTGTALDGGQAITDFSGGSDSTDFDFTFEVPDGQGGYDVTLGHFAQYDGTTGAYTMTEALPAVPQARFCTDETFVVCTAVVALGPGQHSLTLDFDLQSTNLTLAGAVTSGAAPWTGGPVTVDWVGYDFSPSNYASNPPYQEVARQDDVPVDVSSGSWQLDVSVPGSTRFVKVTVDTGDNEQFTRTFELTGVANETLTFDVDRSKPWLRTHNTQVIDQPCSTNVAVRWVHLWALPAPHQDFDFNQSQWPGALADLGTFWVVPDPITGDFEINTPLPPGTEAIGWKQDTPDNLYPDNTWNFGSIFAFGVTPDQTNDIGFQDGIGCYG